MQQRKNADAIFKAVIEQDVLARDLSFPTGVTANLQAIDYQDYFSRMGATMAERNSRFETLTLSPDKEVLAGLVASLAVEPKPKLFFNALVIPCVLPLDVEVFKTILENLSICGLSSIRLEAKNEVFAANGLDQLVEYIKENEITTELELPPGNEWAQQQIDELVSDNKRQRGIASILLASEKGQNSKEKKQDIANKLLPPRSRRKLPDSSEQILGIDIDIAAEVQASVAVEPPIELEEQADDESKSIFIDRDEFIHRAQADAFKQHLNNESIKDREEALWDHWLGNIRQHVVSACDHNDEWKGEIIYDASSMEEDEKSIRALPSKHLYSKENPKGFFGNPYPKVATRLFENSNCRYMTVTACEKLLQHKNQCQYGIDFQRLPAGFEFTEMKKRGEATMALTYNARKARMAMKMKQDGLAVQFYTAPEARPLSKTVFQQWLDGRAPALNTAIDKILKKQYKDLLSGDDYPREAVMQFKRYLPVMRYMTEKELKENNIVAAAKKYQTNLHKISQTPDQVNQHLLLQVLNASPNKNISDALMKWHAKLKFSAAHLNGLLTIYDAYGEPGLAQLFQSWENTKVEVLQHLHEHYFSRLNTYLPLLEGHYHYEDALSILKNLTAEQRAWWNALFQQHCQEVGADNLYTLVKSFQDFLHIMSEFKGLELYVNPKFKNIKSLPVTLSRLVTILNNTRPEDRELVWSNITALDFQSNANIRVITDGKLKTGSGHLVLPAMQMQPAYYAEQHDYTIERKKLYEGISEEPQHGYHAIRRTHLDPLRKLVTAEEKYIFDRSTPDRPTLHNVVAHSQNVEELDRNLYRYLAGQENRLSLGFYQKAIEVTKDIFPDDHARSFNIRAGIFALIAAATSGFETCVHLKEEKTSLNEVKELCKALKDFNLPKIFLLAIGVGQSALHERALFHVFLNAMTLIPPLPYLMKMCRIAQQSLSFGWGAFFDLDGVNLKVRAFEDLFERISDISRIYKYAFYEGIRFFDESKLNEKVLFDFVGTADRISNIGITYYGNKESPKKIKSALMSLMSTFQFDKDEMPHDINVTDTQVEGIACGLELLTHMKNNRSAAGILLTQKDFKDFLAELTNKLISSSLHDIEKIAADFVKEKFKANFAADFFDNLHLAPLSVEDKDNIKKSFDSIDERKVVENILLSFGGINDQFHRVDAVKSMALVSAKLSLTERIPFLNALLTLNNKKDGTLEELNNLLAEMGKCGHIHDFTFMQSCKEAQETSRLIYKITTFYRKALPFVHTHQNRVLTLLDLMPLARRLVLLSDQDEAQFSKFHDVIMEDVGKLVTAYPHEKTIVLDLINNAIDVIKNKKKSPQESCAAMDSFVKCLAELVNYHDPDLVRSLGSHYDKDPLALQNILQLIKSFLVDDQHFLLSMISDLLNNEMQCGTQDLRKFLALLTSSPALLAATKEFFRCPPYPTFKQITDWHTKHQNAQDYAARMQKSYQLYNIKPCERESENGFDLDEAKRLAPDFQGISFSDAELVNLHDETKDVKGKAAADLKDELKIADQLSKPRLLAVLAELLYRSKGTIGGKGNSYEMSTVQYLAVLSFLKSNGHITSGIATGEGKSRIMMLAIACQLALGKTVDFVTSNMDLAQRDFLEYQAFFKMLGVQTSLISATSSPYAYRIKGVNFSDASNLSLFRNKAKSNSLGHLVIDSDESKRALLLDEADKTYYDVSETRYNFSKAANENISNMEWIYPVLIRFFNPKDNKLKNEIHDLYYKNIESCTREFYNFLKGQREYTEERLVRLQALPVSQVETWQEAAMATLKLRHGVEYTLEPNVLINTEKGAQISSEARLIYGHSLSRDSKFSFGIHQCLHAYLNQQLEDPNSAISQECANLTPHTKTQPFFIYPEKQIVYSTSSKSFIDDYSHGDLWGVSATTGSRMEGEEAAALFGKMDANTTKMSLMQVITVPRRQQLLRVNQPIRLTNNFESRIVALVEYIIEARAAGRPVLVIAENDREAKRINEALAADFKKRPAAEQVPDKDWQFVDSRTTLEETEDKIKHAGDSKMVTVATGRLARGADIKLSDESRLAGGLRVLGTYLPRERDLQQMFGRSARYGAPGDARLVVDQQQLSLKLGKKALDSHFFLANEFYIQSQQTRMDREKQVERLIRNSLSDFRIKLTSNFFEYFDKLTKKNISEEVKKEHLMHWSDFTKKADQLWNQAWPDLADLVGQPQVNIHQVKRRLAQFKAAAQNEWQQLRINLGIHNDELPEKMSRLVLDQRTEHLMRQLMPKRKYTIADRTQVYKTYDKALDGRAVVYDELFADWKASWRGQRKWFANTRAWWNGYGILFADTRAWWAGKRPLFATLRASWAKRSKALPEAPGTHRNLLDALMAYKAKDGLKTYKAKEFKRLVCDLDATQFLEPQKGDLLLSFKIQLVETILDYAHDRIEKGKTVSQKDMEDIYELLVIVKDPTLTQRKNFVDKVADKLQHTTVRFFGRSMKKQFEEIMNQRNQEHAEDEQAIKGNVPGWETVAAAAA